MNGEPPGMAKYLISAVALAMLVLAGCGQASSSHPAASSSQTATHSPYASRTSPSAATFAADLKAAGLDITRLIVYTAATDPNHLLGRQDGYTSKVAWQDPRAAKGDAGDTRGASGSAAGSRSTRPQRAHRPAVHTWPGSRHRSVTAMTTSRAPPC